MNWIGAEYPLMQDRITNNYHEIQPDAPGVYDITATWSTATGRLTGTARVNYRSSDIEVKMPIRKGEARVTGHVLLEDAAGGLRAIQGAEVAIGPRVSYFARSGPDGAILLPEVYAGRYQLGYVRGLPADAFVWSVRQGSRDLFKEEMVVGGDEASLEIVVRTGAGVVSGKVTDAAGQPVHNGLVALVPEPPLRERKDYYGAFKEIHTDQNGEFEIGGVTPGAYRAYAWTDAPASAFRNAEFMKAFTGRGSVLTVELNGKASVELKALMR